MAATIADVLLEHERDAWLPRESGLDALVHGHGLSSTEDLRRLLSEAGPRDVSSWEAYFEGPSLYAIHPATRRPGFFARLIKSNEEDLLSRAAGLRSDAPLIKAISKHYGSEQARAWQRLPLVQIDAPVLHRAITGPTLQDDPGDFFALPWIDFVMDLGDIRIVPDVDVWTPLWIRVSDVSEVIRQREKLNPWLSARFLRELVTEGGPDLLMYTIWSDDLVTQNLHEVPAHVVVQKSDPDGSVRISKPKPNPLSTDAESLHNLYTIAAVVARYLTQCPEYLVQESPETSPPRPAKEPKPWLWKHLPRVILLDPHESPTQHQNEQGGSHASPRPHQRRGHWATLRDIKFYQGAWGERFDPENNPRRVFRKPSWIGPREWTLVGNRYRVLEVNNLGGVMAGVEDRMVPVREPIAQGG